MIDEKVVAQAGLPNEQDRNILNSMSLTELMGWGREHMAGPAPLEGAPEAIGLAEVPLDPA